MMTIQITMSGAVERLMVEQCEIVRHCHYVKCEKEFLTVDPDQLYCEPNHQVYQSKWRRVLRESVGAPLSLRGCTPFKMPS